MPTGGVRREPNALLAGHRSTGDVPGHWRETMKYAEEITALAIIVIVGGAILGPIIAALITYHL
jgi:hypothetical protein